uniref:TIL domain-containing protein n=1 Tax=Crocodylus porosus TaxID=8502 RepID=A0A7M4DZY7_CROPO
MQCDNGLEYEACGPACPQTCKTFGLELAEHCDAVSCVEGCFCPEGKVLHGKVPASPLGTEWWGGELKPGQGMCLFSLPKGTPLPSSFPHRSPFPDPFSPGPSFWSLSWSSASAKAWRTAWDAEPRSGLPDAGESTAIALCVLCTAPCSHAAPGGFCFCSSYHPAVSGLVCPGATSGWLPSDERDCGLWSAWAPWSTCSRSCGTGLQVRRRACTRRADHVLRHCHGEETQAQQCFAVACPGASWLGRAGLGVRRIHGTAEAREDLCLPPCRPPQQAGGDPEARRTHAICFPTVDGAWSEWATWANCTQDCRGVVVRRRECVPPQNGGRPCIELPGDSPSTLEIRESLGPNPGALPCSGDSGSAGGHGLHRLGSLLWLPLGQHQALHARGLCPRNRTGSPGQTDRREVVSVSGCLWATGPRRVQLWPQLEGGTAQRPRKPWRGPSQPRGEVLQGDESNEKLHVGVCVHAPRHVSCMCTCGWVGVPACMCVCVHLYM